METPSSFPLPEIELRTDAVVAELSRIHDTWAAGRLPTSAELLAVADDLRRLRRLAEFAGVVAAYDAPASAAR